jgi:hypothetical protein
MLTDYLGRELAKIEANASKNLLHYFVKAVVANN